MNSRTGHLSLAALVVLGVALPTPEVAASPRKLVIPPMPSEELRRLVGVPPEALPRGARFDGAQVNKTTILVRFHTPHGQVRIRLGHPRAQKGHLTSERFSLRLEAPRGARSKHDQAVLEALHRHLSRHETHFQWVQGKDARRDGSAPQAQRTPLGSLIPWIYLGMVLLLLVLGPWLNHRLHRRAPSLSPPARAWDRWDLAALGVMALFAASLALPALQLPLLCDEATNLEVHFWSDWFWCSESSKHPPLFRLIIHATASDPEPSGLIRAPSVIFALVALWLFYRLARERAGPRAALVALAVLAATGGFWTWAFVQKSLTLWLCLLLAAYGDFSRALAGDRRRFARFSLWAMLACLTHYLSVLYLGTLFLYGLYHQRAAWRHHVLAILPAALVTLPLALPMLLSPVEASEISAESDPVLHLLATHLWTTNLLWLGVASLAVLLNRPGGRRETALLWTALMGFTATLILGAHEGLAARYFYPVLPLGLLWLLARLRLRSDPWRAAQVGLLILAGIPWLPQAIAHYREVYGRASAAPLHARYLAQTDASPRDGAPPSQVVLVFPPCTLPVIGHQLTGARPRPQTIHMEWATEPGLRLRGSWWLGVHGMRTTKPLERLLREVGAFDVLWNLRFGSIEQSPMGRWLLDRCRTLSRQGPGKTRHPGLIMRCVGSTKPPLDPRPGLWHYQGRDGGPKGAATAARNARPET